MQTLVQPRLVKIVSTDAKANITMQAKSAKKTAGQKTAGTRFIAVLLSALSAWAA